MLVLSLVTNIVVSTPYRSAEEFVDNAEIEDEVRVEVTANHQEVLFFLYVNEDGRIVLMFLGTILRYWMLAR